MDFGDAFHWLLNIMGHERKKHGNIFEIKMKEKKKQRVGR